MAHATGSRSSIWSVWSRAWRTMQERAVHTTPKGGLSWFQKSPPKRFNWPCRVYGTRGTSVWVDPNKGTGQACCSGALGKAVALGGRRRFLGSAPGWRSKPADDRLSGSVTTGKEPVRSRRPPEAGWRQSARGEWTSASCLELEALVYYKLPLIFEPQPEGGYTVTSPLLPELLTEGDSVADALDNVRDALAAVLEIYQEQGKSLPPYLTHASPTDAVRVEMVVAVP